MAVIYWNSSTGDPSQAASWVGGVPTATDHVIWDGRSQRSVTGGFTIQGARFRTMSAYTGDLGQPGSSIVLAAQEAEALIQGRGHVFHGDQAQLSIMLDSPNLVDALYLTGSGGGGINYLFMRSGRGIMQAGSQVAGRIVIEANSRLAAARLRIETTLTTPTVYNSGGEIEAVNGAVLTTVNMMSGVLLVENPAGCANIIMFGGTHINKTTALISNLIAFGGIVDFSQYDVGRSINLFIKGRNVDYRSHPNLIFIRPIVDLESDVPVFTLP